MTSDIVVFFFHWFDIFDFIIIGLKILIHNPMNIYFFVNLYNSI